MEYNINNHKIFIENGIISKVYFYDGKYQFLLREKCDENVFLHFAGIIIKEMLDKNTNNIVDLCSKIINRDDLIFIKGLFNNISFPKLKDKKEQLTGVYPIKNDGFNFVILQDNKIKVICTVIDDEVKYINREDKEFLNNLQLVLERIINYNYEGFLQIYSCIQNDLQAFNIASTLYNEHEKKLSKLEIKNK